MSPVYKVGNLIEFTQTLLDQDSIPVDLTGYTSVSFLTRDQSGNSYVTVGAVSGLATTGTVTALYIFPAAGSWSRQFRVHMGSGVSIEGAVTDGIDVKPNLDGQTGNP
jgi:hypothetical protein